MSTPISIALRRGRLRSPLVVLGLLWAAADTACMHWGRSDSPAAQLVEAKHPGRIRVTRTDGRRIVLAAPRIVGDSLVGLTDGTGSRASPAPYTLPLADVREVETRRVKVGATIAVAAGLGVTAALVIAAAANSGSSRPPPTSSGGGCDYCYSCPLVYSWDGAGWRLDSGTFGGSIVRALQRTDVDNLDYATPVNGVLRLEVRNELSETDFIDQLAIVAVDHDPGVGVAPDPAGRLHAIARLLEPARATDLDGRDVLPRIRRSDGWRWESLPRHRDPDNPADLRDGLMLVFPRPAGAGPARLVVDAQNTPWAAYLLGEFVRAHGEGTGAWYDSLDAEPAGARGLGMRLAREAFLQAEVETAQGWRPIGLFWEAGPEIVKRQVLTFDTEGLTGDSIRVRLESAPSFWLIDRVALDVGPEPRLRQRELPLLSARDNAGRDVSAAIEPADGVYLTLETGDAAELRFRDAPAAPGERRSYILRSTGWYRLRAPAAEPPDTSLLALVARDPWGVSRASVLRMNDALAALAGGGW